MLGHQRQAPFAKGPWIDIKAAVQRANDVIAGFDVRTPGTEVPVFTLSGGRRAG